jgi:hypothetical protein
MNVRATQEEETTGSGGILSAIGGAIGLMMGGPTGAAIGSGLGSLAGGGSFQDAFKTGIMNLGIGALPGGQAYMAQNALGQVFGGGGGQSNPMAAMFGGGGGGGQSNPLATIFGAGGGGAGAMSTAQAQAQPSAEDQPAQAQTGGLGPFLSGMAKNRSSWLLLLRRSSPRAR